jgi:hypothetical protein
VLPQAWGLFEDHLNFGSRTSGIHELGIQSPDNTFPDTRRTSDNKIAHRERIRSPRRLQNRGEFFAQITMLMRQKGCEGVRSPRRLQNRGDFFAQITMLMRQKGCEGVRSPRRLQNSGAFFAFGESESPCSHAKKGVGKWDALQVCGSGPKNFEFGTRGPDPHTGATQIVWRKTHTYGDPWIQIDQKMTIFSADAEKPERIP